MEFCKECGGLLLPDEDSKKLVCGKCGKSKRITEKVREKYTHSDEPKRDPKSDIIVLEEDRVSLPTTKAICPKCGHTKAYFKELQTRSMDEPATVFMTCVKCKHVWRQY